MKNVLALLCGATGGAGLYFLLLADNRTNAVIAFGAAFLFGLVYRFAR